MNTRRNGEGTPKRGRETAWKRVTPLLLALLIVVGLYPGGLPAARAADETMTPGANVVWHEKDSAGADEVSRIGLAKRESYRYGKVPVFDILLGYKNGTKEDCHTSFMDGGYGSAAAVGGDITKGKPLNAVGSTDLGGGVSVAMKFTGLENQTIVRVDYTVTNSGSTQTVSVGGTVDTCVARDDFAVIKSFTSTATGMKGLVSTANSGEYLGFAAEDAKYWYGQWSDIQTTDAFATYIAKAGTEASRTEGRYDSCMCWLWSESIPGGSSKTFSCYLSVGNLTLGDDPAALETIGKYRVTLDANAGDDEVSPEPSPYLAAQPGASVDLPSLTRNKYTFNGWYADLTAGTAAASPYTPAGDVTLYARWMPILSTVNASVTLNDAEWSSAAVTLNKNGAAIYTLTESGTAGTYTSDAVVSGTYKVYVNGVDSGKTVNVNPATEPVTRNVSAAFSHVSVTTTLDGAASGSPGAVTLRDSGAIRYTLSENSTGVWSADIPSSALTGKSYDVFVGGRDTGADVKTDALTHTVDYYTMTVNLTDDTAWTDADVTLRTTDTEVSAILPRTSGDTANPAVYSGVMQADTAAAPTAYKVFVGSTDTHKTVTATADGKTADVTFYTVTLNVSCSALPDTFAVSITNGADSCVLERGAVSGTVTPFTAAHVLNNTEKATYTALVSGASTAGTSAITFDSGNKTRDITVYKLTYKKAASGEPEWADCGTDYVLSGGSVTAPASPYLDGYSFDGWGTEEWSAAETNYTAFNFSNITADAVVYAHYLVPSVRINGYLRTNADGTANPAGKSYRMPNFTIYGFTEDTIKYIRFAVTNVSAMTGTGIDNGTFNPATGLLTFTTPVSAEAAQSAVRAHIVVTPETGKESTVQATVITDG